jgi:hypothetical protein
VIPVRIYDISALMANGRQTTDSNKTFRMNIALTQFSQEIVAQIHRFDYIKQYSNHKQFDDGIDSQVDAKGDHQSNQAKCA